MGRKITIFLLDGTATGPKSVEIGNWSGRAFYSPRGSLKNLLGRPEFANPGVYFLRSESQSKDYSDAVYIGEAEELGIRLRQHIASKDFESVTCFHSKDEMLTKAHIKYLESRLISIARAAGTSKVENTNTPKPSRLSEADISDMEYFIEQIQLVLPTVGLYSLVPTIQPAHFSEAVTGGPLPSREYQLQSSSINARMIESEDGFILLKGSEANVTLSKSIAQGWKKLRNKLIDAGILIEQGDNLQFVENAIFNSPSAAASVVLGRQAAGPIALVDESGRTYKEIQESAQQNSEEDDG